MPLCCVFFLLLYFSERRRNTFGRTGQNGGFADTTDYKAYVNERDKLIYEYILWASKSGRERDKVSQ